MLFCCKQLCCDVSSKYQTAGIQCARRYASFKALVSQGPKDDTQVGAWGASSSAFHAPVTVSVVVLCFTTFIASVKTRVLSRSG